MIVAITGATGFIGKKLVRKHLLLGDEVRFLTRNPKSINSFKGAHGFLGDLSIPSPTIDQFVDGVDVLYHLAAELNDESLMWQVNVVGTKNLLEAAEGKVGRWIQLSSTGVYGKRYDKVVTEESLLNPHNPYEVSKAEADRLVAEFWLEKGTPTCLLRPSNVYGSEMPNQSLFQLIKVINKGLFFFVGRKGAVVNYIHVDNVVEALILCSKAHLLEQPSVYIVSDYCSIEKMIEVISLSLGKPTPRLRFPKYAVEMLAMICEKVPGIPLKRSRIDAITGKVIYSPKHICESLGYSNHVSIEEGIKELVATWKSSVK
ncbi:MAG: NAD-dependent epimerase/dehydratase family protein [Methylococcales bacterium]|nr:NAD-dependent epimerase/dehydratase family protein [Methylococcales bacterium]